MSSKQVRVCVRAWVYAWVCTWVPTRCVRSSPPHTSPRELFRAHQAPLWLSFENADELGALQLRLSSTAASCPSPPPPLGLHARVLCSRPHQGHLQSRRRPAAGPHDPADDPGHGPGVAIGGAGPPTEPVRVYGHRSRGGHDRSRQELRHHCSHPGGTLSYVCACGLCLVFTRCVLVVACLRSASVVATRVRGLTIRSKTSSRRTTRVRSGADAPACEQDRVWCFTVT